MLACEKGTQKEWAFHLSDGDVKGQSPDINNHIWSIHVCNNPITHNYTLRLQVLEYSSTRTVDNYSSTISRTRLLGCHYFFPFTWHCPGLAPAWFHGFPAQSLSLTTQKLGPNLWISVWTRRKSSLSSLVLKTALLIIIIKSAPSTTTWSKIVWVFRDGSGIL